MRAVFSTSDAFENSIPNLRAEVMPIKKVSGIASSKLPGVASAITAAALKMLSLIGTLNIVGKMSISAKPTISVVITRTFEKDNRSIPMLKQIVLGKLATDSQLEKLIISLFDNNLNVSKTSNCVFMHRNTINNKLSLIKDQTGLDIQNFYDALAMFILISKK